MGLDLESPTDVLSAVPSSLSVAGRGLIISALTVPRTFTIITMQLVV